MTSHLIGFHPVPHKMDEHVGPVEVREQAISWLECLFSGNQIMSLVSTTEATRGEKSSLFNGKFTLGSRCVITFAR